jgi:ABC-type antimicrobial peptide transport system permease subunit
MILNFKQALLVAVGTPLNFASFSDDSSVSPFVTKIMNKVFNSIIIMTMFLSFFALSANMSANLYEQTKEIGVLRSIGLTKCRIRMLYFYEAVVLVIASSLLGVLVGMTVAYAMSL